MPNYSYKALDQSGISENGILIIIAFPKRLPKDTKMNTFRSRSIQIVEKRFWCRSKAPSVSFDRRQNLVCITSIARVIEASIFAIQIRRDRIAIVMILFRNILQP